MFKFFFGKSKKQDRAIHGGSDGIGHEENEEKTLEALNKALLKASKNGTFKAVQECLTNGADVNCQDWDKKTPLHIAADQGNTKIANLLILRKANINVRNVYGETPLHLAAAAGNTDMAAILVSQNANINIKDYGGWTPLHMSADRGYTGTTDLLILRGADINIKDCSRRTPLHLALQRSRTDTANLLISRGANINVQDNEGQTPLHLAIPGGHTNIADRIILRGANIEVIDSMGKTPLHIAVEGGHTDIASRLISRGADINIRDSSNMTPLHLVTKRGYTEATELLLSRGAKINIKTNEGVTPLHMAAMGGHKDTASLLISQGANINVRDCLNRTPLHLATEKGCTDTTALLILKGADINTRNDKEGTPLHLAVQASHTDTAALLISRGADITLKGSMGRSSVDLASGKAKILLQLVDMGISADKANEALKHCDSLDEAQRYIMEDSSPTDPASSDQSESSHVPAQDFLPEDTDKKMEEINQDVALRGIVDPEEFKELLSTGLYESFWNRIYLAGACNVGKTTLASLLIGEDIPKCWKSTDGLRIYFGRNGIDLKARKMIPLKKDEGRRDVLSKVLRGRPSINKPHSEIPTKFKKLATCNIARKVEIQSLHETESALNDPTPSSVPNIDHESKTEMQISSEKDKLVRNSKKRTQKLSSIKFTSVHDDLQHELRRGDYKVEIAPSDLVDFGGQRSYDMTHQLFIQSKGTFTLLFDGRKGLHDPLEEYPQGNVTSETILKHWVDSILTYCGGRDDDILPVILFVATHGDCLAEDQKGKKIIEFKEALLKLFEKHDQLHRIKYNDIFFINGTYPNDPEVERLKAKYVEIAFKQNSWGNKMPMAWVPLELQMSEMRTYNFSIISKDDLIQINTDNEDLALTEKQLDNFLKAQHALGKIVYIEGQGLDKYIIVQPTALVDILRSFITDEMFWPKDERLKTILKEMTDTGKIRKTDLFRLWSQDEFNLYMPDDDFKEFVLQVMVYLDVLVASRSNSDCFLVPCIVKRTKTASFTESLKKDKTICLSYKLLKSSIPAALAFKLICTILNVWPLEETDQGTCLYHNAAILCIDQSNKLYLLVNDDRVIVYLLNTTSKHFISKDFASCAKECLTRTITSCLEFYHRSFGNFVPKSAITDLFEIQVGEICDSGTCYISLSDAQNVPSWKCTNGETHLTEYLLYWTHDKKQKDCKQNCAGLGVERLKDLPNDKHLARLSSHIGVHEFKDFVINLGMSDLEWERIEYKHQTGDVLMMQIDALCQLRKKVMNGPSFQQLHNAVNNIGYSNHILCQIFRDDTTVIDVDNMTLQEVPEDCILQELSRKIGNCAIHLGIELDVDRIEIEATLCEYNKNIFGQNFDILRKWKTSQGNKTIRALMHALWIVDRRGCTFLKEKYNIGF